MDETLYWWPAIQKGPTGNRTAERMEEGENGRNSILGGGNGRNSILGGREWVKLYIGRGVGKNLYW